MLFTGAAAFQQQAMAAEPAAAAAAPSPPPRISLRDRLDSVPSTTPKEAISIKAQLIFDACWKKMEQRLNDVSQYLFLIISNTAPP